MVLFYSRYVLDYFYYNIVFLPSWLVRNSGHNEITLCWDVTKGDKCVDVLWCTFLQSSTGHTIVWTQPAALDSVLQCHQSVVVDTSVSHYNLHYCCTVSSTLFLLSSVTSRHVSSLSGMTSTTVISACCCPTLLHGCFVSCPWGWWCPVSTNCTGLLGHIVDTCEAILSSNTPLYPRPLVHSSLVSPSP